MERLVVQCAVRKEPLRALDLQMSVEDLAVHSVARTGPLRALYLRKPVEDLVSPLCHLGGGPLGVLGLYARMGRLAVQSLCRLRGASGGVWSVSLAAGALCPRVL